MKIFAIFGVSTILAVVAVVVSGETIRLESSRGILVPAPVAHTIRVTRNAYGGSSVTFADPAYVAPPPAPVPSYALPAPSYAAPAPSYAAPAPAPSYAAPAPAPVTSIRAPPCARNYMFTCQPSLSPAPCSSSPSSSSVSYGSAPAPSSSYGSPAAAYSNLVPRYALPNIKELY